MSINIVTPASIVVDHIEDRGTFQATVYCDNRLGKPIGIKHRNGVNAIMPPKTRRTADGSLILTVEYRCAGKARLNQLINYARDNKHLIGQTQPKDTDKYNSDVLRLQYKVTLEELENHEGVNFYLEALDLMISLDPDKEGVPNHDTGSLLGELRSRYEDFADTHNTSHYIRANVPNLYAKVRLSGVYTTLPVCASEIQETVLVSVTMDDGVVQETSAPIDRDSVIFLDENKDGIVAKKEETIPMSTFIGDFISATESVAKFRASISRDVSKVVQEATASLEKAADLRRTVDISEAKHQNTMASESAKMANAAIGAGIKIMDILKC